MVSFIDDSAIKSHLGNLTELTNFDEAFSLNNPTLTRAIADVNDSLWDQNPGYAFSVATKDDPFSSVSAFSDFVFQINPSAIRQEEDFSILPRPTQTGVAIEHEGFVFKRLTISGTTGINPKRGYNGYHEFATLINYIRAYAEFKTDPQNDSVRLVFKNYKDNEFWFVEPQKFVKNRVANQPFTSQYDIQLLITGRAQREASVLDSFFQDIKSGIDQYIIRPLNSVQSLIQDGIDIIRQVEGEVDSIVINPLNEITEALDAISRGVDIVSGLPRNFYEDFRENIIEVGNALADLFGYNSSEYDEFYSRITTRTNPTPEVPSGDQVDLLNAFIDLEKILDQILSTDQLFEEPTTNRNVVYENYFSSTVSIPVPVSTKGVTISRGDTLERIAARELGTSDRALELITLNNLVSPYIEQSGTSTNYRVKNPGDSLLIPVYSPKAVDSPDTIKPKTSALTRGLTALEKSFGVDLKLSNDYDLIVNNRSDYDYIYGVSNAIQAVLIKINLEKGSLPVYPQLGINVGLGQKVKASAAEILTDLRMTILQDPRFTEIAGLTVMRDGAKLSLDLKVLATSTTQPVPIRISLD